ncbi:aminotransferase class IV [Staphylococcus sp. 17KM0847]|uniref:aminotransferase class IV n=1 Tax=Staphylococcus sp. 17KM0847 TaxID=2583989 RepID=UPI0015DD262C|nr:aminotransferase class IV [Staphylococcus sp. 17KM0847]QLK85495.1 aminodeoxychorismate lyase [Staphylococcus sp. 17KM0847]
MYIFETMRLEAGFFPRESYHQKRIAQSAQELGFHYSRTQWQQVIRAIQTKYAEGCYRVKIKLQSTGEMTSEVGPLLEKKAMTAHLVKVDIHTPKWARINKTSTRDFLHHDHQTDVILLYDDVGKLLEFDIGNLVIEYENTYYTPRYEQDFLRGCMRESLLECGEIVEAALNIKQLQHYIENGGKIWMINSLRAWVPIALEMNE